MICIVDKVREGALKLSPFKVTLLAMIIASGCFGRGISESRVGLYSYLALLVHYMSWRSEKSALQNGVTNLHFWMTFSHQPALGCNIVRGNPSLGLEHLPNLF